MKDVVKSLACHGGIPCVQTRVDSAPRAAWPSLSSSPAQMAGSSGCVGAGAMCFL